MCPERHTHSNGGRGRTRRGWGGRWQQPEDSGRKETLPLGGGQDSRADVGPSPELQRGRCSECPPVRARNTQARGGGPQSPKEAVCMTISEAASPGGAPPGPGAWAPPVSLWSAGGVGCSAAGSWAQAQPVWCVAASPGPAGQVVSAAPGPARTSRRSG